MALIRSLTTVAAAAALALGAAPPTGAAATIVTVAGGGIGAASVRLPSGIFLDSALNLYVAEAGGDRVTKWVPGATTGVVVAGGNGRGSALNQLDQPSAVVVDSAGTVFVADAANSRVMKWTAGATTGVVVAGGNGRGSGLNQLHWPEGLLRDSSGNLYISDSRNARVVKWAPNATSGVLVVGANGPGSATNQLDDPQGLAFDSSNRLYIVDSNNDRVVRWSLGATSGVVVAGGNGAGQGLNQLYVPRGVAVDATGDVYVSDGWNNRVMRWSPGAVTGVLAAGGNGDTDAMNVTYDPTGVTLDSQGRLYVAEANDRVNRWTQRPGQPRSVVTRSGYTTSATGPLVVSFLAPLLSGGETVTKYAAICTSPNGGVSKTASGTTSPITVTGATTGKQYSCMVTATNAVGTGRTSAGSEKVILGSPSAPTLIGLARPASGSLRVAFVPNSTNGSTITGFAATCVSTNFGVTRTASTSDPAALGITVTGLSAGKSYRCQVNATNARGTGLNSAYSGTLVA